MTERAQQDVTWAKLPRQILHHPLLHRPRLLKVWLWCRLRAAYRPVVVPLVRAGISYKVKLQTGQFIASFRSAGGALQLTTAQTQQSLSQLIDLGLIAVDDSQWYTVITVIDEGLYQPLPMPKKQASNLVQSASAILNQEQASLILNNWQRNGQITTLSKQLGIGVDATVLLKSFKHHLGQQRYLPVNEDDLKGQLANFLKDEWA